MNTAVTVIVVSFSDPAACARALRSALAQTQVPFELLVVDNDPEGSTVRALARDRELRSVQVIHPGRNLGYTRAVNLAAARSRGEWLFLLNPDATVEEDCLERLLDGVDGPDVALVGAQVLLADGRTNAGENPVSVVGISWAGGYGGKRERGRARDVAAVSGAALLVRREVFLELGGLCPWFFMYVDDVDLAWRMRLGGWRVRYCPDAAVVHDYVFDKGPHKWFYLERNRAWALLSNLQLRTLVLLAPLLALTEMAVIRHAIAQKWLIEKVRAWLSLFAGTRRLLSWRRRVQKARRVSDYRVLDAFCGRIDAPTLGDAVPEWANCCLEAYRGFLLWALAAITREQTGGDRPNR